MIRGLDHRHHGYLLLMLVRLASLMGCRGGQVRTLLHKVLNHLHLLVLLDGVLLVGLLLHVVLHLLLYDRIVTVILLRCRQAGGPIELLRAARLNHEKGL